MAWWRRIVRRWRGLESEEDSGLPRHVDLWMHELIEDGMDPQAAREEALRSFGLGKGSEDSAGRPGGTIRRSA
jgi:hypothetical protein